MRDLGTMTREEATDYLDHLIYLEGREDRDYEWIAEVEEEVGNEVYEKWVDDNDVLHVEPEAYREAEDMLDRLIGTIEDFIEGYESREDMDEALMRDYRRMV